MVSSALGIHLENTYSSFAGSLALFYLLRNYHFCPFGSFFHNFFRVLKYCDISVLVEKPGGREGKVVGAPSRKPPALVCPDRGVGACSARRRPIGLGSNMLLAGVTDDSRDSGSGVTGEGREETALGPVQPGAGFNGTGARAFVMCRGAARGELGGREEYSSSSTGVGLRCLLNTG
jgi:hypothetical protein